MERDKQVYTITIRRTEGNYLDFILELEPSLTVLDALEEIRYTMDDSLQYRHSCHHGSCGTCACVINGKEGLACMTFLSDFPDGKVSVEPLRSFPLIADLVVDLSSMVQKMPRISYLRGSEVNTDTERPEDTTGWVRFENCIECGSCVSACPVEGPFLGPSPLAAIHREILKRDDEQEKKALRAIAYSIEGVPSCDKKFACSRVCPTKVSPGKHITELRREADAL